jgi:serine/threonine-protein kinase ATR
MLGYRWMTALPQLMSRVCHKHKAVQSFLTSTLSAITNAFPSQTLWQLASLSKSQVPLRSQRALAVLKPYRTSSAATTQLVRVAEALVDELIRVAGEVPENDKNYSLRVLSDNSMFKNPGLILPLLSHLTVVLAPKQHYAAPIIAAGGAADGFSKNPPMIHRFEKHVDVMSSKEKPKKITVEASDGKRCVSTNVALAFYTHTRTGASSP